MLPSEWNGVCVCVPKITTAWPNQIDCWHGKCRCHRESYALLFWFDKYIELDTRPKIVDE